MKLTIILSPLWSIMTAETEDCRPPHLAHERTMDTFPFQFIDDSGTEKVVADTGNQSHVQP